MRIREKEEELRKLKAQQEAVDQELLSRQAAEPKDIIDEEYFKDHKRFRLDKDQRDPIFRGSQGSQDEKVSLKDFINEGWQSSAETMGKIKESRPFAFTSASTKRGRFGFTTYTVSQYVVIFLLLLIFGLLSSELLFIYQSKQEELEMTKKLFNNKSNK